MKIKDTEHNFGDFFYSLENNAIYKYQVVGVNFDGFSADCGGPRLLNIEDVKPTYVGIRHDPKNGSIITKLFADGNSNYHWNIDEIWNKLKSNIQ